MDDPAPPPRSLPPRTSSSIYRTPDLSSTDRRYAFSRNASFRHSDPLSPAAAMQRNHSFKPHLYRSDSSIGIPPSEGGDIWKGGESGVEKRTAVEVLLGVVRDVMSGSRPMKRLAVLILMNVAYSTAELMIGLLTGRVGLVSDAFHLTFGCGLLTFSLFAMAMSRKKNDGVYTYGTSPAEEVMQKRPCRTRFPKKKHKQRQEQKHQALQENKTCRTNLRKNLPKLKRKSEALKY